MKKLLMLSFSTILFSAALILSSCSTTPPMYNWSTYDLASYKYIKNNDEESLKELLKVYDTIINGQANTVRQTVPPGICADYGYMLIKAGKTEEGTKLLKEEIELYPESKTFVTQILGMVKNEKK